MSEISDVARKFFDACEAGEGWRGCAAYCHADATFSAQAEPLADLRTLEEYADWMKGLMVVLPDGRYDLKSFATDRARNNVCAYAVFSGTHTGPGGPCPPGPGTHPGRMGGRSVSQASGVPPVGLCASQDLSRASGRPSIGGVKGRVCGIRLTAQLVARLRFNARVPEGRRRAAGRTRARGYCRLPRCAGAGR